MEGIAFKCMEELGCMKTFKNIKWQNETKSWMNTKFCILNSIYITES